MFLNKETVLKKLELALKIHRPRASERAVQAEKDLNEKTSRPQSEQSSYYIQRQTKSLNAAKKQLKGFNCLPGIPYRPRLGIFKDRHVTFDPSTGESRSYDWYVLGKVINGLYVVNSYRYSRSTNSDRYSLKRTLELLGIDYVELDAPEGLQDLDASLKYHLKGVADILVAKKYSKNSPSYREYQLEGYREGLALLQKLGVTPTKDLEDKAMAAAEKSRDNRLAQDRESRDRRRIAAFVQATRDKDLKGIIKFHKHNAKRLKQGKTPLAA